MNTAEEILKACTGHAYGLTNSMHIVAMKAYAQQVAEQALKDAAERATCSNASWTYEPKYTVDSESILSTPIVTP